MTYSVHFRKKVLAKLEAGTSMREAATQYELSTATIQSWKRKLEPKAVRDTKPRVIHDDALRLDVELHPDSYQRERADRLNCSTRGIGKALKRIGITQKKDFKSSKSQ
jgi:transposase